MSRSFCHFLPDSKTRSGSHKKSLKRTGGDNPFVSILSPAQSRNRSNTSDTKPQIQDSINFNNNDIIQVDSKIKQILMSRISTVPELMNSLNSVLWIATNSNDMSEQIRAEYEAEIIRSRIKDLENSFQLAYYILQTSDILEEYKTLSKQSKPKNFMTFSEEVNPNRIRLDILEEKFMAIAQGYIQVDGYERKPQKMVCSVCGISLFKVSLTDDSIYICKNCGAEFEILDDSPSFKDTDRINMSAKYTYTREGHFRDSMKKFQGIQTVDSKKIKDIKGILLEEMKLHNLVNERNLVNSVTKDHLYDFLTNKKLNKYYEDVNLLFNMITGEACPNIQHLQESLLEDFAIQEEGYEHVRDPERVNSLNVYYKLYKLLQRRGYPCRKSDFYILKTKAKENEHDETTKRAWEYLGWEWIPTW